MQKKGLWFVVTLLLAGHRVHAQPLTPADVFKVASPSVVVVKVYDERDKLLSFGSGVVIAGGIVATNYHVLRTQGAQYAEVEHRGKNLGAELKEVDAERDLCTLKVAGLSATPAKMGSTQHLEIGAKIYAIGAPEGYELTLSDGLISGKRSLQGNSYLQVTAPISHGSSGGGLFDGNGRLIGITTLMDTSGQALNFAIPAELIAEMPARNTLDTEPASRASAPEPPTPSASANVGDSRWLYLAEEKGSTYYLDKKSARVAGTNITGWIKEAPIMASWVEDGKEIRYHEQFLNVSFFCATREMEIAESYITNNQGVQLATRGLIERFSVSPNSSYDPVIDAVCAQ